MSFFDMIHKYSAMQRDTGSTLVVDHGNGNRQEYVLGDNRLRTDPSRSRTRKQLVGTVVEWPDTEVGRYSTEAELLAARARYIAANPGAEIWTSKPFVNPNETHKRYHPTQGGNAESNVTNKGCLFSIVSLLVK